MAVVARHVEGSRAILQAPGPVRPEFNFKKPDAARSNLVLMGNAGRTKVKGERAELPVLPLIPLGVQAVEEDGKEGQLVRVRGQLAGRGVT